MDKETIELLTKLGKQLAYSEVLDLLQLEMAKPTLSQQDNLTIVAVIGNLKNGLMELVRKN